VKALRQAFGTVDNVDLWTGGLSEKHAPGAVVGPTFQTIIADQFEALRDGDRYWYENQGFDPKTLKMIENTRLSDIIERNTETEHIQDDTFVFFERRTSEAEPEHPEAPQLVIGADGQDTLTGGPKGDMLVAGQGEQRMTGGGGDDLFVFSDADSKVTVVDFQPGHDVLEFDLGEDLSFADAVIEPKDGHAVVKLAGARTELLDVQPCQLKAENFLFKS